MLVVLIFFWDVGCDTYIAIARDEGLRRLTFELYYDIAGVSFLTHAIHTYVTVFCDSTSRHVHPNYFIFSHIFEDQTFRTLTLSRELIKVKLGHSVKFILRIVNYRVALMLSNVDIYLMYIDVVLSTSRILAASLRRSQAILRFSSIRLRTAELILIAGTSPAIQ